MRIDKYENVNSNDLGLFSWAGQKGEQTGNAYKNVSNKGFNLAFQGTEEIEKRLAEQSKKSQRYQPAGF